MALTKISVDVKLSRTVTSQSDGMSYFLVSGWEPITTKTGRSSAIKWSIWFDLSQDISEGDYLTVEGDLSTKVGEYTKDGVTKQVVEHSLNNPVIISNETKTRRGGSVDGHDQDDIRKYGTLGSMPLNDEDPF